MSAEGPQKYPPDWAAKLNTLRQKIAKSPDEPSHHHRLGILMSSAGRMPEGMAAFDCALQLCPTYGECWHSKGLLLEAMGKGADAYACFARAVVLTPHYKEAAASLARTAEALYLPVNVKNTWRRRSRLKQVHRKLFAQSKASLPDVRRIDTEDGFRRRLMDDAVDAEAAAALGSWLAARERTAEAEGFLRYALEHDPGHISAALSLSDILSDAGRTTEARSVLTAMRSKKASLNGLMAARLLAIDLTECRWDDYASLLKQVRQNIKEEGCDINPFSILMLSGDMSDHLICAVNYSRKVAAGITPLAVRAESQSSRKLRIGYLSADFHDHAVASLVAELFELHDRKRFKIFGYALWLDDGSELRRRIRAGVDKFHELWGADDRRAAEIIRNDEIDILVDLTGYTKNGRPRILAHRPAPVQVNYLGFPGTMGADFVDYIIADPMVAPLSAQPVFRERIVHLPGTYQINDRKRAIGASYTRDEVGLPDRKLVYCNFNGNAKIAPPIFEIWMRVLKGVPDSVLWLLSGTDVAVGNLRKEAARCGIEPARLIFAAKLPRDEHLARYKHADLFLDTLPYNAHTTASDALWAGCPVLTCTGTSFAGRAGSSIVGAANLTELVTQSLSEYEALAIEYGRDAQMRRNLQEKLRSTRMSCALFDSVRATGHLESAFETMWERYKSGAAPGSFVVAPLP